MKTHHFLSYRDDTGADRSARRFLAVWSLTLLTLWPAGAGRIEAAPLTLTTLVRTNDLAPGSGTAFGLPDGFFRAVPQLNWEFSPPVAAVDGHFAFRGHVEFRPDPPPDHMGGGVGIWGGVAGRLGTLFQNGRGAPGTGGIFEFNSGPFVINELGHVAFTGNQNGISPGGGLWWGDTGSEAFPSLEFVDLLPANSTFQPLENGNYIGYPNGGTNWNYNKLTRTRKAVTFRGMAASVFGPGVTVTNVPGSVGMDDTGRLLVYGVTSDGVNRLFLASGPDDIRPVLAIGQPAPGIPGKTISFMGGALNHRGYVAVHAGLNDGESALFVGPAGAVKLIARSTAPPPGMPGGIWIGTPLLSRSNHVLLLGGVLKLPDDLDDPDPDQPLTFKPIFPPDGLPPGFPNTPPGSTALDQTNTTWQSTGLFALNELGQVAFQATLRQVRTEIRPHPINPGQFVTNRFNQPLIETMWLFNPGVGLQLAAGGRVSLGGEEVMVNKIGFVPGLVQPAQLVGVGGADGRPTGLANDGNLVFTINGTHIVSTQVLPAEGFIFNGQLDTNWHTTRADPMPPSNWHAYNGTPQPKPPGDAEPGGAEVTIPAGFSVLLDQRPAPIGRLNSFGKLTLREQLRVGGLADLHDLTLEGPNGWLTAHGPASVTNFLHWRAGRIDGGGSLRARLVALTNGGASLLGLPLTVTEKIEFDGNPVVQISQSIVSRGDFLARSGLITNIASAFITNEGRFVKTGPGEFNVFAFFANRSSGLEIQEGLATFLRGGSHRASTINISHGAALHLARTHFIEGHLRFTGKGDLLIGTASNDFFSTFLPQSSVTFDLGRRSAHFYRGQLSGASASARNEGLFVWHGGRIALGTTGNDQPSFFNAALFEIADDNLQPRRLDGAFINSEPRTVDFGGGSMARSRVYQDGSLELVGRLENRGDWEITQPVTIRGAAGTFANMLPTSLLHINNLGQPGTVAIESTLIMSPGGVASRTRPGGRLIVGSPAGQAPATVVQLRGPVLNLAHQDLEGGRWEVHRNGSLEFPTDIESITDAVVVLDSGDIPSLKLRRNFGSLEMIDKAYATPEFFHNGSPERNTAELTLRGASTLTVNGDFENFANVSCGSSAKIVVNGSLYHERGGYFDAKGEITATGGFFLGGPGNFSGIIDPDEGAFMSGAFAVGASPGTVTVIGRLYLTNTATLIIELAGTQTNQFDRVVVTESVSLGGTLAVNLIDGFRPGSADVFPIVQAAAIAGRFANATNGQRIATIDGYGSTVVNYTPTAVVLSAFQLNPNPSPTSPGRLLAPSFAYGHVELTLTGSPGRDYILQTSTNLLNWLSLLTNNASFDGQLRFELPATTDPYRFFRAVVP